MLIQERASALLQGLSQNGSDVLRPLGDVRRPAGRIGDRLQRAEVGVHVPVAVVDGDDALYGDGLGPKSSPARTYLDMMRHNTATIVGNLR